MKLELRRKCGRIGGIQDLPAADAEIKGGAVRTRQEDEITAAGHGEILAVPTVDRVELAHVGVAEVELAIGHRGQVADGHVERPIRDATQLGDSGRQRVQRARVRRAASHADQAGARDRAWTMSTRCSRLLEFGLLENRRLRLDRRLRRSPLLHDGGRIATHEHDNQHEEPDNQRAAAGDGGDDPVA